MASLSHSSLTRASLLGLGLALAACNDGGNSVVPPGLGPVLDVSFDAQTVIATGVDQVRGTVVRDLDGDGRPDLAALGGDGSLVISLNQPNGVFVQAQTLVAPSPIPLIESDDVDLDGDRDLIVISATSGEAVVFRNDGDGTFIDDPAFLVGNELTDLHFADLDGDGAKELILTRIARGGVEIFQAIGDGSFVSPRQWSVARGNLIGALSSGDFDGDGDQDLAFADVELGQLTVLRGDGAGGLQSTDTVALAGGPFATAVADVDNDGADELFVADLAAREVVVFDAASMTVDQTIPVLGQPTGLSIADVSGDGLPDLAVTLADFQAIAISQGGLIPSPGGGTMFGFSDDLELKFVGGSPIEPVWSDFDVDGDRDLVVTSLGTSNVDVFFRNDDGNLSGGRIVPVDQLSDVNLVATGRFDPTGTIRLAAAQFGNPGIVLQDFAGDFVDFTPTAAVTFLTAVDLPGDDLTDLVVSLETGVQVLRNLGVPGGLPTNFVDFEVVGGDFVLPGALPLESKAADFDGDGVLDICATFPSAGRVSVALGSLDAVTGAISFGAPISVSLSGEPAGLATGDFDGDGIAEIAVTRVTQSLVTFIEMSGPDLVAVLDFPVASGPTFLRTGDLDGDLDDELIVAETSADQVSVLDEDGSGSFNIQSFAAGDDPTALILDDLNNDGSLDLVITEFRGTQFRVLLGDGSGGFSSSMPFTGPSRVFTATLADVDLDGLDDLVVGGFLTGGYGLFRNTSVEAGTTAPAVAPSTNPADPQ